MCIRLLEDFWCAFVFQSLFSWSFSIAMSSSSLILFFTMPNPLLILPNVFFISGIIVLIFRSYIWVIFILLFSSSVVSNSLRVGLHGLQHTRLPYPSWSFAACSNSCPSSQWCHPIISSSIVHFSCLQSFPASGSFLMSQLFASGDQSIRASASASVLPVNTQDWFPFGLTGLISLLYKGLSRFFSNTTVQKHQFFSAKLSLALTSTHDCNYHVHTPLLEKP